VNYPLPARLVGVNNQLDLETKSLVIHDEDRLLLLSRSKQPRVLFSKTYSEAEPEQFLQKLLDGIVKEDSDMPFWIALVDPS
jgi:hypothetical protein